MYFLIIRSFPIIIALSVVNPTYVSGQASEQATKLSDGEIASAIEADIADASRIAGGEINVKATSR